MIPKQSLRPWAGQLASDSDLFCIWLGLAPYVCAFSWLKLEGPKWARLPAIAWLCSAFWPGTKGLASSVALWNCSSLSGLFRSWAAICAHNVSSLYPGTWVWGDLLGPECFGSIRNNLEKSFEEAGTLLVFNLLCNVCLFLVRQNDQSLCNLSLGCPWRVKGSSSFHPENFLSRNLTMWGQCSPFGNAVSCASVGSTNAFLIESSL